MVQIQIKSKEENVLSILDEYIDEMSDKQLLRTQLEQTKKYIKLQHWKLKSKCRECLPLFGSSLLWSRSELWIRQRGSVRIENSGEYNEKRKFLFSKVS